MTTNPPDNNEPPTTPPITTPPTTDEPTNTEPDDEPAKTARELLKSDLQRWPWALASAGIFRRLARPTGTGSGTGSESSEPTPQQANTPANKPRKLRMSDLKLWRSTLAGACISLFLSLVITGVGFSSSESAKLAPIGLFATLTAALTLYRLRILQPTVDETGRTAFYADWRKAMQKPLEAVIGLPAIFLIIGATKLAEYAHPGSDAHSSTVTNFAIGLFAWTALSGLIGSAGADAAALISKKDSEQDPADTTPPNASGWAAATWGTTCIGLLFAACVSSPHLTGNAWLIPWTLFGTTLGLWVTTATWNRALPNRHDGCRWAWSYRSWIVAFIIWMAIASAQLILFAHRLARHTYWEVGTRYFLLLAFLAVAATGIMHPNKSFLASLNDLKSQWRRTRKRSSRAGSSKDQLEERQNSPRGNKWLSYMRNPGLSIVLGILTLALVLSIGWRASRTPAPPTSPSPSSTTSPVALPPKVTCTIPTPQSSPAPSTSPTPSVPTPHTSPTATATTTSSTTPTYTYICHPS